MMAFALTYYDDNQEPIEDPTYGLLKAYYKTWGLDEDDYGDIVWVELESDYCTSE